MVGVKNLREELIHGLNIYSLMRKSIRVPEWYLYSFTAAVRSKWNLANEKDIHMNIYMYP